ncbi:MAG: thiol:disulfide interchange protein DsbA/DsbL [Caldimonas sp.]
MTLTRRDFSTRLLGAGLAGSLGAPAALAQGAPVEGVNYVRLTQPLPVAPGKIEVIEFFWYECPHCNAFEPALEAWSKKLPQDVVLRRVPVWFREEPFSAQQRIYYALETLGLVNTLHRRVFYAIHDDHTRLRSPEEISAFMAKNGVDAQKFMAAYNSFAVQAKALQARQVAEAYRIDAVPAMGVQGRYYTNGSLANANGTANTPAGSNDRMLGVVDVLIAKARQPGA